MLDIENGGLPDLEEIAETADEKGFTGPEGRRRGIRNLVVGEDYISMDFVKETKDEYTRLDDHNQDTEDVRYPRRVMRLLLLESGHYGFESRRDVKDGDALRFLLSPFNLDYDYERYEDLTQEVMHKFYKESYKVRKIKARNIGEREPNPTPPPKVIQELVEESGDEINNSTFSTGREDNNLQEAEVVDEGFAKMSDLSKIKSKDRDGEIEELRVSGRLEFSYPSTTTEEDEEDITEEDQGHFIRNKVKNALDTLFRALTPDEASVDDEPRRDN